MAWMKSLISYGLYIFNNFLFVCAIVRFTRYGSIVSSFLSMKMNGPSLGYYKTQKLKLTMHVMSKRNKFL